MIFLQKTKHWRKQRLKMQLGDYGKKPRNKDELLDYLRSFDLKAISIDSQLEIIDNVEEVMKKYLKEKPLLKPYYDGAIKDAKSACKDVLLFKRFKDSISDLIIHLEQE